MRGHLSQVNQMTQQWNHLIEEDIGVVNALGTAL
jgi:hypothetical protein